MGKYLRLHCTSGGSDKLYDLHVEDCPNNTAIVYGMNGRRGAALTRQDKTNGRPVPMNLALSIYEKIKKEKLAKQYRVITETITTPTQSSGNVSFATVETTVDVKTGNVSASLKVDSIPNEPKPIILHLQLLNEIPDEYVMRFIEDDAYMAQEKKDGRRHALIYDKNKHIAINKKGEEIPALTNIVKSLPQGIEIAIDGELIGEKLHAFDILMRDRKSLRELDAIRRYSILATIPFGKDIVVVETAFTKEEKLALYNKLKEQNKEGIVFKRKNSAYKGGRPNKGGDQLKNKFQKTASFIVDSHTDGKRSVKVVVLEGEKRVEVGKCTIPPNKEIPAIGSVVEIQYLYAYKGGAIFQPVYLHERDDVDAHECVISQLVYKSEESEE